MADKLGSIILKLATYSYLLYQDRRSCVSGQERHAAHKCIICRNHQVTVFDPSHLYNYWTKFHQFHTFYVLCIQDFYIPTGKFEENQFRKYTFLKIVRFSLLHLSSSHQFKTIILSQEK